jgi:acyl-CoA synthetase (AMP-forming)/AMP-acid ligase II
MNMLEHLFDIVVRHARESEAKVAISQWVPGVGYIETSYGELVRKAKRFAGLQAGQRDIVLPMLVGKSADSVALMLGTIAAGRPFCFLSPKYRGPQVVAVLEATQSPICVADAAGVMALRGAWKNHPRLTAVGWVIIGERPQTKIYLQTEDELRKVATATFVGEQSDGPERCERDAAVSSSFPGACLFTSGSTGLPKGVLISEADLLLRMRAEIGWFGLRRDDVLLSILPFSFDVGLNQLMTALGVGAELVLLDSWLPADILRVSEDRRVTGISCVPSIWQDMINAGALFETAGRHASLRYITVSGGSLSREYLLKLRNIASNVRIFKTYGQTEAFRATSLRPEDFEAKLDSVGRPFADAHVYVVREDLTRCAAGEIGEVVHSGLGTMLGYLGDTDGDNDMKKLRKNPFYGKDDPYPFAIFTGDMGYLDDDGYLFLKGRQDSMLKVMGNRVYPQEVANQLLSIATVREAVVVGVMGENGQAKLVAFVVATPGTVLSAGAIKRALGATLPAFMIPKEFIFVDQLPRTLSGKPNQRQLIEEYIIRADRAGDADGEVDLEG